MHKEYKGWMIPQNETHFQKHLFKKFKCDYQFKIHSLASRFFDCKKVAIDIGANIGMMTLRYSKQFDIVHSFEPIDINYKCLQLNTKHVNNVKLYKIGLGDQVKKEKIYNKHSYNNSGGWSINDWNNKDWIHYDDQTKLISQDIIINTLDQYNLKPDFIKIDTQNYEMNVLLGAHKTIMRHSPIIQIELDRQDPKMRKRILKHLMILGYKVIAVWRKDHLLIRNRKRK